MTDYRVLVVEDSSSARTLVRASLEEGGQIQVHEASSGVAALKFVSRGQYDLIVTDVNMPDINGLELLACLRSSDAYKTTPIVIISTESSERDRERALSKGATAYLAKPFDPAELRQLVHNLLGTPV